MRLQLHTYPDSPFLVTRAKEVPQSELGDPAGYELQRLVRLMIRFAIEHDGVGLAAPQVGISKRIFVFKTDREYVSWSGTAPVFQMVINPVIHWRSPETVSWEEGCLSLPGLYGYVERAASVNVSYFTPLGYKRSETLQGMQARIFQHEYDHLDGILFPQRIHEQKYGKWINLKPYSREEIMCLDFINELRYTKTKTK